MNAPIPKITDVSSSRSAKVVLTQDQQTAADDFFRFLMSDASTFAISGSAGVGKTFLMGYLSKDIMRLYEDACRMLDIPSEYDTVVFTATTNKAAEVLEEALGIPVQTIHSFLSLKVKENYRTGKTTLEKTDRWHIRSRHIVFIDECSMIDKALYEVILNSFAHSKIVFVGDHAQMAPVNEDTSEVYQHLEDDNLAVLTQPVRNAGCPPLITLCAQLRDTVETGIFHPINEVPGVIDYLEDEDMPMRLRTHFITRDPSARVLCFTNSRVQAYNEFIREEVRGLPPQFTVGDIVVVAQPYQMGKVFLSVERELEIARIGDLEYDESYSGSIGEIIPFRRMDVKSSSGTGVYTDIKVPEDRDQLNRIIKHFQRVKQWTTYFELKQSYADFRDKAACTVYKSQGSTYDTVFVDLGNIGTSRDPQQVARMLFVAISRARFRVFLYGRLPGQYHNSGGPLWVTQSVNTASQS